MKTVCFIVRNFPSTSETFVVNQIVQAKKNGYNLHVYTTRLCEIDESSQQALLEKNHVMENVHEINFEIPKSKITKALKAFRLLIKYFKYWIKIKDASFRNRFLILPFKINFYHKLHHIEVFHVQFALMGTDLAVMKSIDLLKGKLITTFHGYDAHYANEKDLSILKKRYRSLIAFSDAISANTAYLSKKLLKIGVPKTKLSIVPMGVDVECFSAKKTKSLPEDGEVKLISVGRLVAIKGFKYALLALKKVIDSGYNVSYTIVGDGEDKEGLVTLIKDLKLETNVTLIGKQNQDRVRALLDEHQIFIMSSIQDETGRAEAQGLVTAEAQAMGLPVVAFASGGVPFTIKEKVTGYLVPEKNTEALAEAVVEIIKNPELYEKMCIEARKFVVEEFSDYKMGQRFKKIYG